MLVKFGLTDMVPTWVDRSSSLPSRPFLISIANMDMSCDFVDMSCDCFEMFQGLTFLSFDHVFSPVFATGSKLQALLQWHRPKAAVVAAAVAVIAAAIAATMRQGKL